MARNTQVAADPNAPPITQTLARFVATHPSRGWSDAVDHEAHRTFLNWLGCAVGAARHEAADAALAAVRMLEPAAQATVLGRRDRVDMAGAALVNGITSHTFDYDDTHLKTIIHPAGPVASALLALAEHSGASRPPVDRRAGAGHRRVVPRRQRDVPRSLRPRLAHHRFHRHARRGRRLRPPAGPGRAAHGDGAGHRRFAANRHARAVRHHDQALPSGRRGARRADVGAVGQERLHRQRQGAGGAARHDPDRLDQVRLARSHRRTGPALRDFVQQLQAVCLRHRDPSQHRRLRAIARAGRAGPSRCSASN